MYTARIVLCFALLGAAAQACAEDTPYRHEYLNGGYFEGASDAEQVAAPSDDRGKTQAVATPDRPIYHRDFDGEAATQANRLSRQADKRGGSL